MRTDKQNQRITLIQQTFHKSMFHKKRSNSIGALPKDFDVSGISALTQEKTQTRTKEKENNWQRDQVPAAKRKRAETSPLQYENAKKRPNNISYAVPTQNQFDILDDTEDTTNVEPPKPPKPEPIFVTGVIEVNSLKNVLKKITTNNNEYTMTTLRSGHIVKIMPTTIEVYKTMRQTFISENISHYTYKLKSERAYRVVLQVELQISLKNAEEIELAIENLNRIIHIAAHESTPISKIFVPREHVYPTFIKDKIHERR
ncbi:Uncharacterized protein OBRU01_00088, partial [Operophtera brumata]